MAHFAKIGTDNIVTNVIVVNNEDVLDENNVEQEALGIDFIHNLYNDDTTVWVQTSYNNNFRKTMLVLVILMMKQEMLFMHLNLIHHGL